MTTTSMTTLPMVMTHAITGRTALTGGTTGGQAEKAVIKVGYSGFIDHPMACDGAYVSRCGNK